MMFSAWNDITHITAFNRVISIVYHELVSFIQVTFVVANRCRSLMVHHHFNSFACSITMDFLYVEIRICSQEVKYIVFAVAEPVFPSFIPTFYQHCIKSVGCGKVDVTFHVSCIGRMFAVRFGFGVVCNAKFHAGQFICISPGTFSGNHVPPYAYIFHRFNPGGGVCNLTRFVQVEGDAGGENVTCIITDDDRTPRRVVRSLHVTFIPFCIRCQPGFEYHVFVVQIEVHTRIINQSGFVQIDV